MEKISFSLSKPLVPFLFAVGDFAAFSAPDNLFVNFIFTSLHMELTL